jgi:hypothetical protein
MQIPDSMCDKDGEEQLCDHEWENDGVHGTDYCRKCHIVRPRTEDCDR